MDQLLKKLNIDESLTKPIKKIKKFNKVKHTFPPVEDWNFISDLLILPKTKAGFRYLLVIIDYGSNEFDIEELKNKDPKTVLKAMETIFKRKHLNKPKYSLRTDGGTEFKGSFAAYLKKNNIFHSVSLPSRHSQMANVESLNRQLGRLYNGYMNNKEFETGKQYNEWTDVTKIIREDLNKLRKTKTITEKQAATWKDGDIKAKEIKTLPKFKIGDIVLRQLDKPRSALNKPQNTENFREGDLRWDPTPRKIIKVFMYKGDVRYRYMLTNIPNVSFAEHQLKKSTEKFEKFNIKAIIGKRTNKKKLEYLIWFEGSLKKNAEWQPASNIKKDAPLLVKEFEADLKKKPKKK